jgi:hypothetical protein
VDLSACLESCFCCDRPQGLGVFVAETRRIAMIHLGFCSWVLDLTTKPISRRTAVGKNSVVLKTIAPLRTYNTGRSGPRATLTRWFFVGKVSAISTRHQTGSVFPLQNQLETR